MKRTLLVLGVLLAACTQTATHSQSYKLTIDEKDTAKQTELVEASTRVIDRRLGSMGDKLTTHSVTGTGASVVLTVTATSTGALARVTEQLQQPFDIQFMSEAPEADADLVVAGHGGFKATGITENDIDWTIVSADPTSGKARVELQFTPAGMTHMQSVFKANEGKIIGLFVRKKLISKLLVNSDAMKEHVVIGGIPTLEIAKAFSDDVNVGLHVVFTQQ